jgi:TonB-dependent receptor
VANQRNSGRGISASSSWLVLGLLAAGVAGEAAAQSADAGEENEEIVVVGVRASQQSAINRKREARTATDSIVADDVGSFPDRNVNEAISRVAGVALGRNEFGEGESVAVRGNGPDLTRIELDGIGVQSTTGLALNIASGRSADLRELPAELIKSVDVVKGSTADMTEGGLGGTIQIETRTGLDFSAPYFTVRAGANRNSLGQEWMPDFNAVAARQFFDGRLGLIVSGNYTEIQNNGHSYEATTSNNRGYARLYDFDQSPEKTFEYNLDTLGTDAADIVFANSDGTTPRSLLTDSISAQTKEECFELFPHNPTGTNAQRAQRILEQQTCLNQWNDATPSLIRNFMNEQNDERIAFDARLDYRVTDDLTVFAKGAIANRYVHDQNRSRTPISLFNANLNGTFLDTTSGYPRIRSVAASAPEGYFLYDGLNNLGSNAVIGNVLNVVPESIEVDENHNVTRMTLTNNSVGIDQIENIIDTRTEYAQIGAEYRTERWEIDAMAGLTQATSSRGDMRTARTSFYGDATLTLQPNGLWDIDLPDNYDDTNPANFVQLRAPACIGGGTAPTCIGQTAVAAGPNGSATPAYTVGQMPLVTPGFSVSYSPALAESSEEIAKFDAAYKTDGLIPFITRIKAGVQYRSQEIDRWGGGGLTVSGAVGTFGQPGYVPAVIVPTANVRGSLRACEPTEGSSAPGGLSCNFGFVPSTNPLNIRSGVDTLTPEQLLALFAGTLDDSDSDFFEGLPDRGDLPPAWQGIRTDLLFARLGAYQFMNFDCLKTCMGSDGVMYEQPIQSVRETVNNVYLMADFEQPLPLGLLFDGNVGVRGVFADVEGAGVLTLNSIRTTPDFNPLDPTNPAGIVTQSFTQNTTVTSSTEDWLPSVNLNLWGFDETVVLRIYGGKTVVRPNPGNLLPGGTCTIDERILLDGSDEDIYGCSGGRVGNPGLKPFTAWNYNASLEWYPNEDTLFSVTYGRLDVQIGNPIAVTQIARPFEGSDLTDPVTGEPLADFEFSYPTWANGPGYERDIWEFQAKTAFTFLPWLFRYTGADANYSILTSAATTGQQDPLTGDVMPPPDESKYYVNASLWYDDGRLNARVTYQYRSERFSCITPCGGNNVDINYPGEQWTNVRLVAPGYNPGVPRFIDETTYIDAKASYQVTPHVQVYVEGRNLSGEAQTISTGEYVPFADGAPKIMRLSYGGRRFMTGVRFQFGGTAE